MPFIDVPSNDENFTVDLTAKEKLEFNNEIFDNNWANDVSMDVVKQGQCSNEDVIRQSILNILLTMKGERLFNLEFGTNLFYYLFDDNASVSSMKMDIYNAIKKYEHRVTVTTDDIKVYLNMDQYYIEIQITYYIKTTREIAQLTEKLYL